jgi:asparagine synthase (glutamine-hydrolysing)
VSVTLPPAPTPRSIEILASLLLGVEQGAPSLPRSYPGSVRDALEEAILPALLRPPCFVSFSGGRDSSAILAVALDVARRHGLAAPIPATKRFPTAPETSEGEWQDIVLEHLGVRERVVIDLHEELDGLGDIATNTIRRHGVRFPANAYMHVPLFEVAQSGAVLTGAGGDELLGSTGARAVLLAHGRVRPRPRDVMSVALALSPRRLRAIEWRRRRSMPYPWLRPAGRKLVHRAVARDAVEMPQRWNVSMGYWYRTRAYAGLINALPLVASDFDVGVTNPFLHPSVLRALAQAGGPTGFASRTAATTELFGDLLPKAILTRPTKASFSAPVWGPATRQFAAEWSGEGVDHRYVDAVALREEWLKPVPHYATMLLMQSAWLHEETTGQPSASSS